MADDGTMTLPLDPVLSLFPEQRLELRERARTVQRSVAKLIVEHMRMRPWAGAATSGSPYAAEAANVERTLRQVLHEYVAILRHLGAPPEAAIADVKQLVTLVARGPRRASEETTSRIVRWAIEGYYGR